MRPERGLACLRDGCAGRIPGRHDMRHGELWTEGDEHDCPVCGAEYEIIVDDGIAELREREVSHER